MQLDGNYSSCIMQLDGEQIIYLKKKEEDPSICFIMCKMFKNYILIVSVWPEDSESIKNLV